MLKDTHGPEIAELEHEEREARTPAGRAKYLRSLAARLESAAQTMEGPEQIEDIFAPLIGERKTVSREQIAQGQIALVARCLARLDVCS